MYKHYASGKGISMKKQLNFVRIGLKTGLLLSACLLPIKAEEPLAQDMMTTDEVDAVLNQSYSEILNAFEADPDLKYRFETSSLTDEQRFRLIGLYKEFSRNLSAEEPVFSGYTDRSGPANVKSYQEAVQSSAFVLGDGVADTALKYLYNGDGRSQNALLTCGINDRNPVMPGCKDERTPAEDHATLWIPHIGTWYGEPVGMSVSLDRHSSGNGSNQSIMLQPGDFGTNIYYEDIADVTNTIRLYRNVDLNNPHVNGEQISLSSDYTILAGSHGMTDEDLTWAGVHYRSAEASGPLTDDTEVYTDHPDWLATAVSTTGHQMYYCGAYRKTIRVSYDVSNQKEAVFRLGVVGRGGTAEVTQDGGFDFNSWLKEAKHATFVVIDPNGGTYLGSEKPTHHEGLEGESRIIENSVRDGYQFDGYDFVQQLGTWNAATGTYVFGAPQAQGIRYGKLVARWKEKQMNWTIRKSVDCSTANINDLLTYTITLFAQDDASYVDADSITVTDTLPDGLTFVPDDPSVSVSGQTVTKQFQDCKKGTELSFRIKARINQNAPPVIKNSASFRAERKTITQTGTSDEAETALYPALITVNKSVDRKTADIGDILTYTLSVANTGKGTAKSIRLIDPIPKGTAYLDGGTYDSNSQAVTFTANHLEPGKQQTFSFRVTIRSDARGTIENTAHYNGTDYTGTPIQGSSSKTVTSLAQPSLEVTKSCHPENGSAVALNDRILYRIHVKNTGQGTARNVEIKDAIPEHTVKDSDITSWMIESLKPNEERTLEFAVLVSSGEQGVTIENEASYRIHGPDLQASIPWSFTNKVRHVTGAPNITMTKSANPKDGSAVSPGQIITYTLHLKNIGTAPAGSIMIKDTIAKQCELESGNDLADGIYNVEDKSLQWTVQKLAPQEEKTILFKVRVKEPGGIIENQAEYAITGDPGTTPPEYPQKTNTVTHTIVQKIPVVDTGTGIFPNRQ